MRTTIEVGLCNPSNGAENSFRLQHPYIVLVEIQGTADLLFHRWDDEEVQVKSKAKKNSEVKKTDNLESYVYRLPNGNLALPGAYLKGAIVGAAKFYPDPRSPRKSAQDLIKGGIIPLTDLADLGVREWSYEHRCRVVIQRNAVTRIRPAVRNWRACFELAVQVPEYIDPPFLNSLLLDAGRLIGLGDYRPTYGRFAVSRFEILE